MPKEMLLNTEPLNADGWCDRCAKRFMELDPELATSDAEQAAQDVYAFERTRAMGPEAAASFVAYEMSRPDRARFERRSVDRSPPQPFLEKVLHILTPGAPGA